MAPTVLIVCQPMLISINLKAAYVSDRRSNSHHRPNEVGVRLVTVAGERPDPPSPLELRTSIPLFLLIIEQTRCNRCHVYRVCLGKEKRGEHHHLNSVRGGRHGKKWQKATLDCEYLCNPNSGRVATVRLLVRRRWSENGSLVWGFGRSKVDSARLCDDKAIVGQPMQGIRETEKSL